MGLWFYVLSAIGMYLTDIPGIFVSRLIPVPRRKWGWYIMIAVFAPLIRVIAMWAGKSLIPIEWFASEHSGYITLEVISVFLLVLLMHFVLRLKLRETLYTALIIFVTSLILFYAIGYATKDAIPKGGIKVGETRIVYPD